MRIPDEQALANTPSQAAVQARPVLGHHNGGPAAMPMGAQSGPVQARPALRPANVPVQRPAVVQPSQGFMPNNVGMAGNGPVQSVRPIPVAAPVAQPGTIMPGSGVNAGVQGVNAGDLGRSWNDTFI